MMRKKPSSGENKTGKDKAYKKSATDRFGSAGKSFRKEGDSFRKHSSDKNRDDRGAGSEKKRSYQGRNEFSRDDDGRKRPYSGRNEGKSFDKPARRFESDRPARPYADRPKRDNEDRSFKGDHYNSDRPKRTFTDKKKQYGDDRERPARRFDENDKPKRTFTDKKKQYGDDRERPARRFDENDKPKRTFTDRKKQYGDDRERPARRFEENDKPRRTFTDRKKQYGDDRERPARRFEENDKPKRNYDREEGNDGFAKPKAGRSFGDKPKRSAKPAGKEKPFERKVSGPFRKRYKEDEDKFDRDERYYKEKGFVEEDEVKEMTLNKYIAHSSTSSRRDAAELVKHGKVKVNGELMLDPGYRVQPYDKVTIAGKKLTPQKDRAYVLLNKPKGYITTTDDPEGRKTVMELVEGTGYDRLYPVGRLDRNTTGLLLLTNDGDLAQKLSHPSYETKKVYQVSLDKPLAKTDFEKIVAGLELEDGPVKVDELAYLDDKSEIGIEIHSGRNRVVRRIFESLGYEVEKLDRVMFAGLTKKNLPRGKWRFLTDKEIILLKHFKS